MSRIVLHSIQDKNDHHTIGTINPSRLCGLPDFECLLEFIDVNLVRTQRRKAYVIGLLGHHQKTIVTEDTIIIQVSQIDIGCHRIRCQCELK